MRNLLALFAVAFLAHGYVPSCKGFFKSAHAAGISQLSAINLTAAGTRQALSATKLEVTSVAIQALAANTGVIYVGDVAVAAANGYVLQKGDTLIFCAEPGGKKIDLARVYFDGGTTNDDIKVTYATDGCLNHVAKPL